MRVGGMHFVRAGIIGSALCVSSMPILSAHAQASFTYNNGYGETIDPVTGAVTGGTQYTYSQQIQAPYTTLAGTTSPPNPVYGSALNTGVSRIYSSFTVAQGTFVSLNTLTLDLYVKDQNGTVYNPTTQDPFSGAHIAVYDLDPNNFGDLSTPSAQATEHGALVGGDDTFATNSLVSASFSGNYRFASASDGDSLGSSDISRPVFNVGVGLGGLTLQAGTYFFVVSVDVNQSVAPNANAFAVIADPTDAVTGQPTSTDGNNGIYNPNGYGAGKPGYFTDQPEYNGPSNPMILDAFPYSLTGNIDATPEPDALSLLGLGSAPVLSVMFLRRRQRKSLAKS